MDFSTNPIDLAVLAILAISIAAGCYQGLLATGANLVGCGISLITARLFYPGIAMGVKAAGKIIPTMLYYSETADMLGTVENYHTEVAGLTDTGLKGILNSVTLPHPMDQWFSHNVLGAVFAQDGISNLGDYLARTIAETTVNICSFLLVFLIAYLAFTFLVNMLHYSFRFPGLPHFDGLIGGAVGLVRGALLIWALFLLMPAILSLAPVKMISDIVADSKTAGFFYEHNILFGMIKSFIG